MNHINFSDFQPEIFTFDGPAAVGKGTLCRLLKDMMSQTIDSKKISILDAGLTYRMLTYYFQNINVKSPGELELMGSKLPVYLEENLVFGYDVNGFLLNGRTIEMSNLKTPHINDWIARYAGIDPVKLHIVESQKRFIEESNTNWWLLDGRCMGTAVAPNAIAKIYVDADPRIKAGWRYQEYRERGITDISSQAVFEELEKRDKIDKEVAIHPLKIPYGSFFVWSHMATPEDNAKAIYDFVSGRLLKEGRLLEK